ncbi:P22 phage major capsid protein family protein [Microbacterium wangruii]|uniref:P22 phage major capsid protein family protein n=1 Tax=Microbacterium wangruii TaxID=3049073 RepID=UPI00256F368D|nr:P22 phage major capsid protein family protein [Microbacterium sp. zg-Y1211]MDL5487721.1 P22 phage major capsid protein family protein [Microbacterium sp. zg-Y1211]
MTNPDYTAQTVADVAVRLFDNGLKIGADATHYTDDVFVSGTGGTVNLRIPGVLTARTRLLRDKSSAVTVDEIIEGLVPVSLTGQKVSAVGISDAELSLDITDFARQVLRPQVDAVVASIEHDFAELLAAVEPTAATYSALDPAALFIKGRSALRARGVDVASSDLIAYVGGNVYDALLASGALSFDKTGDADAIRKGIVGRVHGVRAIETSHVADDEVVFTIKGGLYLATRAPQKPEGVAFGQTVKHEGVSLSYLRDYDGTRLTDRSIVSTFAGVGISLNRPGFRSYWELCPAGAGWADSRSA